MEYYVSTAQRLDAIGALPSPTVDGLVSSIMGESIGNSTTESTAIRGSETNTKERKIALGTKVGVLCLVVAALAFLLYRLVLHNSSRVEILSLAVLPLRNQDGAEALQYLVDATSSELTDALSSLPYIRVLYPSAVERFSSMTISPSEAGHMLGVDAIVSGEVTRQENHVFVTVDLTQVNGGKRLWKETFTSSVSAIQVLKKEIVERIASELSIPIPELKQSKGLATSGDVYDLYLQGKYYKKKGGKADNELSIKYFNRAVQRDSDYLPALASLADALVYHFEKKWTSDTIVLAKAGLLAKKIIKADSMWQPTPCWAKLPICAMTVQLPWTSTNEATRSTPDTNFCSRDSLSFTLSGVMIRPRPCHI